MNFVWIVILETKIIVADNYSSDIQEEVDNLGFEMNLSFVPIPSDEDWGTADSLRHISDYIQVNNKYIQHNMRVLNIIHVPIITNIYSFFRLMSLF